jgi:hypothetical protein
MDKSVILGVLALTAFWARPGVAAAPAANPSLTGSFVRFDRNFTLAMWQRELATQAALGQKILILPGDGTLAPTLFDATGFTVDPQTLIYPSALFPASPPQPDQLGMLLTAADQYGIEVFIGSLQTYDDWSVGDEFDALHKYDPMVAAEILAMYGSHPSLNSGGGNWYFSHELWLNWVEFYGLDYYGIGELATFVTEMKSIDGRARIVEAPVFKKTASGPMPGLSPARAAACLAMVASGSLVDIVAPQDGAGAQAGAAPVAELRDYYSAMSNLLAASIASGTVELWATTETYQAAVPGTESADGWQPAPLARIRQQLAAEVPYVSQLIQYMYGWDMSPEATYTPVEADTLLAQYSGDSSAELSPAGALTYSIAPAASYADSVPSKLSNGTGGGFGQPLAADWVGFFGNPSGTVTVTLDLMGPRTVTSVRTLFAGSAQSGIYFPDAVVTEYSGDGGVTWLPLGSPAGQNVGFATPPSYAVGWVVAANGSPVVASQVRVTVNLYEWLFLGEIKVMEPTSTGAPLALPIR